MTPHDPLFFDGFSALFQKINELLQGEDPVILAIDGGSASGKTTLSAHLAARYDCNVFHMDDFFLRPEQRSEARLAEAGGNVDRERFFEEILLPLSQGKTVVYRPYDCSSQSLGAPISVTPKRLSVVEGVYSMHPDLSPYYDCSVFLDIDPILQRDRIQKRNPPPLANRFFEEWIPLENYYFTQTETRERCLFCVSVSHHEAV